MSAEPIICDTEVKSRTCALRYLSRPVSDSSQGPVVLFASLDDEGLRLYVHRGLKQLVSKEDLEYIETLLPDLRHRCQTAPEELFAQLLQLSVGPLVNDARDPEKPFRRNSDFYLYADNEEACLRCAV